MNDYILFFYNDVTSPVADSNAAWARYIEGLQESGAFRGGSEIGAGECLRKDGTSRPITAYLGGFIRVEAESIAKARAMLAGNPVFEGGGTVEVRELPRG